MGAAAKSLVRFLDSPTESLVRSSLDGPIESLGFLRRSLLFAELSNHSYLSREAYIFANQHDAVVTCRGTEPHDWNDVRADLDLGAAMAETVGWVHRGFKREVDDLWPRLEQALVNNSRPLWFAGHSLGGAMAAICAGRCKLSYIRSNPRALFTYGSPRIGSKRYVNYVQIEAYRWVNNNDIVTRVPPAWLGFRHKGQEVYLNAYGKVRRLTAACATANSTTSPTTQSADTSNTFAARWKKRSALRSRGFANGHSRNPCAAPRDVWVACSREAEACLRSR
jgi:triacylglycerol lipase